MDVDKISARARRLFAKRDRLEAELRAVDAQLSAARSDYRVATHTFGIDMVRFRKAVQDIKVAA